MHHPIISRCRAVIAPHRNSVAPCGATIAPRQNSVPQHGAVIPPHRNSTAPHGAIIAPRQNFVPQHGAVISPHRNFIAPCGAITAPHRIFRGPQSGIVAQIPHPKPLTLFQTFSHAPLTTRTFEPKPPKESVSSWLNPTTSKIVPLSFPINSPPSNSTSPTTAPPWR